jgi:hypothetical protein
MTKPEHACECGCGCDGRLDRREFLGATGAVLGGLALTWRTIEGGETSPSPMNKRASVRVVFLYPPSTTFSDNPDGWWSWPGNEFDAEGRQRQYTAALRTMEEKHGVQLVIDDRPVADNDQAQALMGQMTLFDSGFEGTWPL